MRASLSTGEVWGSGVRYSGVEVDLRCCQVGRGIPQVDIVS